MARSPPRCRAPARSHRSLLLRCHRGPPPPDRLGLIALRAAEAAGQSPLDERGADLASAAQVQDHGGGHKPIFCRGRRACLPFRTCPGTAGALGGGAVPPSRPPPLAPPPPPPSPPPPPRPP